jgi:hypothetical protein
MRLPHVTEKALYSERNDRRLTLKCGVECSSNRLFVLAALVKYSNYLLRAFSLLAF